MANNFLSLLLQSGASKQDIIIILLLSLHGQVERLRRKVAKLKENVDDCQKRLRKVEDKEKQKSYA